ncbi:hypothetical protein KIW84_072789 [Lathyrus oleraceus]|uniref:GUCT domain-containing protein n=1 Tax=Pisum sativum TaxID=3888 RepID=A0A9D4ZXT0_PEA|nr:hypothetical protein KIW84_072789 [Pisum sativum]
MEFHYNKGILPTVNFILPFWSLTSLHIKAHQKLSIVGLVGMYNGRFCPVQLASATCCLLQVYIGLGFKGLYLDHDVWSGLTGSSFYQLVPCPSTLIYVSHGFVAIVTAAANMTGYLDLVYASHHEHLDILPWHVSTGFAGCCCYLVVKSWLLQELLNNSGLTAVELLAKALAKAVGYTEVKKRSLLTSMENYVTLLLEGGKPMFTPSFAFGTLRRFIPEDKVDGVQGLALTADGQGAVF